MSHAFQIISQSAVCTTLARPVNSIVGILDAKVISSSNSDNSSLSAGVKSPVGNANSVKSLPTSKYTRISPSYSPRCHATASPLFPILCSLRSAYSNNSFPFVIISFFPFNFVPKIVPDNCPRFANVCQAQKSDELGILSIPNCLLFCLQKLVHHVFANNR